MYRQAKSENFYSRPADFSGHVNPSEPARRSIPSDLFIYLSNHHERGSGSRVLKRPPSAEPTGSSSNFFCVTSFLYLLLLLLLILKPLPVSFSFSPPPPPLLFLSRQRQISTHWYKMLLQLLQRLLTTLNRKGSVRSSTRRLPSELDPSTRSLLEPALHPD